MIIGGRNEETNFSMQWPAVVSCTSLLLGPIVQKKSQITGRVHNKETNNCKGAVTEQKKKLETKLGVHSVVHIEGKNNSRITSSRVLNWLLTLANKVLGP